MSPLQTFGYHLQIVTGNMDGAHLVGELDILHLNSKIRFLYIITGLGKQCLCRDIEAHCDTIILKFYK